MPPLFDRFTRSRTSPGPDTQTPETETTPPAAVLDALPFGIAILDAHENLVTCNTAMRRLLAIDEAMLRSQPKLADLVAWSRRGGSPETGLQLTDGRPQGGPRRTERRLPGAMDVDVHADALPGGGVVITLQDVSAHRQALDLLRQARAAAEAGEEEARLAIAARNQFAFNMAHELRTPLSVVSGMLQAIEAGSLDAGQRESLSRAQASARTLADAMANIIDVAAIDSATVTLHPRPFEVEDLLRDLADGFCVALGTRPLEFAFDIDPQLPARLVCDDQRLRQVLLNLGGQAIRGRREGSVFLRVAVLDRAPDALTLEFSIGATDPGADADLQALPERAGDADVLRRPGAGGMGLSVCRQLLTLMGSTLEVRGTPAQGSVLCFRLTLGVDAARSVAPVAHSRLRVLIADSRPASRAARVRMARALGWHVQETTTLAATCEALRQSRYLQLALVDWALEGSQPFTAALQCARLLEGRHVPMLVAGPAAGASAYAALPPDDRQRLGPGLFGPASPGMLADAVRQAQGDLATPRVQGLSGRALAGLRVLVAEDNEHNQLVIRNLLQSQGATVEIAVDGLDTLTSIVANGQYDLILMDWQMPNMDGLEATREIRRIVGFESIPIIALTVNASPQDREACLAAGMDAHLAKPVDARELVATVLRHTRPGQGAAAQALAAPQAAPAVAAAPVTARPMIDRSAAIDRLGGDRALYDQVMHRVGKDAPALLGEIRSALKAGSRSEAKRHAHSLKSNAALIGAEELAEAAGRAQAQFAGADPADDDSRLEELACAVDSTLAALDPGMS